MSAQTGEIFDVAGCAEFLGRTQKAVRKDIERGRIPYRRLHGTRIVFRRSELLAWLDALEGVTVEQAVARARGEAAGRRSAT